MRKHSITKIVDARIKVQAFGQTSLHSVEVPKSKKHWEL